MIPDDRVRQRLLTARGHLEAVVRMVDVGRYCFDVLHQVSAIQGALAAVRRELLEVHLRECVPAALAEGRLEALIEELLAATFGAEPRVRQ